MAARSKRTKGDTGESVGAAARRIEAAAMRRAKDSNVAKPEGKSTTKGSKGSDGKVKNTKPTTNASKRSKLSALDAAAQVLESRGEAMRAGDLIETMAKQGLWTSPGGKTPDATLSAAINREITKLGRASRFKKADRGLFEFVTARR